MEAAGAAASFQAPCDMPPQRDTTAKALLLPRPHGGASGACKGGDDSFCLQCPNAGGGTDARRFGVRRSAIRRCSAELCPCGGAFCARHGGMRHPTLFYTRNSLSLLFAFRSALVLGTYMTNRSLSSY
ncbi:hypothetical protein MRX96_035207 [Rhipicephalus microplus]